MHQKLGHQERNQRLDRHGLLAPRFTQRMFGYQLLKVADKTINLISINEKSLLELKLAFLIL